MARIRPAAFTLVELLVVVAIIAVLISLLVPAIDQAMYQAELAMCGGGRLDAIASGVTAYAFDHKRRYPYRPSLVGDANEAEGRPNKIYEPVGTSGGMMRDDRTPLLGYVNFKMLEDPFCELDLDPGVTSPASHIYSNYELWFGFAYKDAAGGSFPGMNKVGDRVVYFNKSLSLLANDMYQVMKPPGGGWSVWSSHPEKRDAFTALRLQDEKPWWISSQVSVTMSFWSGNGMNTRIVDRNFAHADGSVRRLSDLSIQAGTSIPKVDPRLTEVPYRMWGATAPTYHDSTYVPAD